MVEHSCVQRMYTYCVHLKINEVKSQSCMRDDDDDDDDDDDFDGAICFP